MYPEPDAFKPERFLNPDGSSRDDPVLASTFGFGKRICPGRHLADATLFIVIASLLSCFNVEKLNSSYSGPDAYPYLGTGGVRYSHLPLLIMRLGELTADRSPFSRPRPFRCSIIPRDKRAEELIAAEALAR